MIFCGSAKARCGEPEKHHQRKTIVVLAMLEAVRTIGFESYGRGSSAARRSLKLPSSGNVLAIWSALIQTLRAWGKLRIYRSRLAAREGCTTTSP
ncbi:hypothetical protein RGCCGE502_27312 (plasmid) [Rhizobium grahamii CCGE 502]|uniref:Uncharacterized protein n=1 Tax=Rhizobium grahamii CCGE 502 TaxID=990285 RepID=S3HP05_9HYPH|nr:hypothetical protein RGCCGE502_27312 [Rhizobium grahamii CCGE 502]